MPDILFIVVLALVIFGPKKLPEVLRQVAKFMAQFRMMRDDLRRQVQSELLKIELEEKQKALDPKAQAPAPVQEPAPTPAPPKSLPEGAVAYGSTDTHSTTISEAGA
ncbi:MAG TPA: twin-arginine translocase TatA/TatE family subunit [Candidatus Bathyarchaeia archaeon]|nr:twin-arginine translocase TatA/TatE family subunit [Candidatus Bathyarchaeia archaeon]